MFVLKQARTVAQGPSMSSLPAPASMAIIPNRGAMSPVWSDTLCQDHTDFGLL